MKKIALTLVVCLLASISFAQEIKKDTYIANGNVIEATLYHANGAIAQTGFYTKANKLQGEWISYDNQGNKTAIAQYDNGNKVGTWFFYQEDTIKEVAYADARMTTVKTYKITDTRVVGNYK